MSHVVKARHEQPRRSVEQRPAVQRAAVQPLAAIGSVAAPALARRILRDRRLLGGFFDAGLFADPALDLLLDLFVAGEERRATCVTDCCVAAAVPATTALRWIDTLKAAGLLREERDPVDRRRRLLALTPRARAAMLAYLNRIGDGLMVAA